MRQASDRSRRESARNGLLAYLSFLALTPVFLYLGVRSWLAPGIGLGITVVAALYSWWQARGGTLRTGNLVVAALLNAALVGSMSSWLGPFVLVPTAAAISALYLSLPATRGERVLLAVCGLLSVAAPLALELAGVVPPSFRFEEGRLVLLARSFELPPRGTLVALVYVSLSWIAFPLLAVGRIREALARAERQLFLHAWQFRRLLGGG
jgi:serine/threonine-protein kinase